MVRVSHGLAGSLAAFAVFAGSHVIANAQQLQQAQQRPQRVAAIPAPAIAVSPPAAATYITQLVAESKSKQLCESVADRVFIRHDLGTECIAYYATPGQPQVQPAVFYFEGDVPAPDLQKPNFTQNYLTTLRTVFRQLSEQTGVRFVFIGRPGLFGSSGTHGARRAPTEMLTMNLAVDAVKARLKLTDIVLAGQSGGSTVSAALLTLGRRDVTCAILGSGLLSVVDIEYAHRVNERLPEIKPALMHVALFDPTDRLDWIAPLQSRRVFVLGDPTDTRTPFPQQRSFADRMRALGHHATAIEVTAQGELMHSVAHLTLPAAALCARGANDAAIRRAVTPTQRPAARTVTSQVSR